MFKCAKKLKVARKFIRISLRSIFFEVSYLTILRRRQIGAARLAMLLGVRLKVPLNLRDVYLCDKEGVRIGRISLE